MTPSAFRYARPGTLDDAVALLGEHGARAQILAGGQSLIPLLSQRLARPSVVIDINRVPDLDGIEVAPDHIRMGALVRQEQARRSSVIRDDVPGLCEALEWVANPVIRERGTVVGNLVANAPGTELPAVAVAWEARFAVRDRRGERLLSAADVLGDGRGLEADAFVTHVLWPRAPGRGGFYEVARRDGHAPVVGAMVSLGPDQCRVGLCGVAATGMACPTVARAIFLRYPQTPASGEIDDLLNRDLAERVNHSEHVTREARAFGTAFGTAFVGADYRRDVAPIVIRRALEAAARAGQR